MDGRRRVLAGGSGGLHLTVDHLDGLGEVGLDGVEGGDHRRRAEAVSDGREVGQVALHGRVDERRQTRVAYRRPVLIQHVQKLLHHLPARRTAHNTVLNQQAPTPGGNGPI